MGPLWLENLLAYSLQVALLATAGILAPRLLRLRSPRVLYAYGQLLLLTCLLLPLVQPWKRFRPGPQGIATTRIFMDAAGVAVHLESRAVAILILSVLAAGVASRTVWLGLGCARLARYRKTAVRFEPLPHLIRELESHLGVFPELAISNKIQGPATFGLRHPMILFPPQIAKMDSDRQQAIAGHEMLHVARRDWIFHLFEEFILTGFWFHPAVWWLVGRIRLSREQLVDRQVVGLTGARKSYLFALVEIAAGAGAARALLAPAFLTECQLAERIRALAKEDVMSKRRIAVTLAGLAALTLLAGLASVRAFPLKGGAVATSPSTEQTTPKVYRASDKGVTPPTVMYKPEPPYTKEARAAKLQGTVVLTIVIAADGAVTDVKVVQPFDKGLTENAVETIKTWQFHPAMKAGKPVPCKVSVEVSFKLF